MKIRLDEDKLKALPLAGIRFGGMNDTRLFGKEAQSLWFSVPMTNGRNCGVEVFVLEKNDKVLLIGFGGEQAGPLASGNLVGILYCIKDLICKESPVTLKPFSVEEVISGWMMTVAVKEEPASIRLVTDGGVIEAGVDRDNEYPGIHVMVDDVVAAVVEYDSYSKEMRVRTYTRDDEEPVHSYRWDGDGTDDRV